MTFPLWLTLAFIILKLIEAITWSWLWVLSPAILVVVLAFITELRKQWRKGK